MFCCCKSLKRYENTIKFNANTKCYNPSIIFLPMFHVKIQCHYVACKGTVGRSRVWPICMYLPFSSLSDHLPCCLAICLPVGLLACLSVCMRVCLSDRYSLTSFSYL